MELQLPVDELLKELASAEAMENNQKSYKLICRKCKCEFESCSETSWHCDKCRKDQQEKELQAAKEWAKTYNISGKFLIFYRDNFRCIYCGDSPIYNLEIKLNTDHIVPKKLGGKMIAGNLVTSCSSCNKTKRDILLNEQIQKELLEEVQKRNQKIGLSQVKPIGTHNPTLKDK